MRLFRNRLQSKIGMFLRKENKMITEYNLVNPRYILFSSPQLTFYIFHLLLQKIQPLVDFGDSFFEKFSIFFSIIKDSIDRVIGERNKLTIHIQSNDYCSGRTTEKRCKFQQYCFHKITSKKERGGQGWQNKNTNKTPRPPKSYAKLLTSNVSDADKLAPNVMVVVPPAVDTVYSSALPGEEATFLCNKPFL